MAKTERTTAPRKASGKNVESKVSEPQASYLPKTKKNTKPSLRRQKSYDARRFTGMIPGIADRMKEYVKHMRDDR